MPQILCNCIQCEPGSAEYYRHLLVASVILERVSCLIYRCWDGKYRKPSVSTYKAELFTPFAELPGELIDFGKVTGATTETAEHVHEILWQIADLVCPMMACISEQGYINEYAYAIDYVIRHNGTLPKPEFKRRSLFPGNYKNYHYWEAVTEETGECAEISL